MEVRHAAQIIVVRVEAFGRLALGAFDLRSFELRRDRADDTLGHLVLQREDVAEGAFKTVRPDVAPGRRIDELSSYAYPPGSASHAAFEHVAHAQLAAHLLHVHRPALVGEARVARDD